MRLKIALGFHPKSKLAFSILEFTFKELASILIIRFLPIIGPETVHHIFIEVTFINIAISHCKNSFSRSVIIEKISFINVTIFKILTALSRIQTFLELTYVLFPISVDQSSFFVIVFKPIALID